MFQKSGACWVWPAHEKNVPNQYVEFKHEFDIDNIPEKADLYISAGSNYAVWLNGKFVNFDQYHDYPDSKVYDILPSASYLVPGKNVLVVLGYYQGEGSFQYIKSDPGIVYALDTGKGFIASGKDTLYRKVSAYKNGPLDRITGQLGFTFEYNASEPTASWAPVSDADLTSFEKRPVNNIRPISKLVLLDRLKTRIAAQGVFTRKINEPASIAEIMQTDYLSPKHSSMVFDGPEVLGDNDAVTIKKDVIEDADGIYLVLDLGREEAGYLNIDLEANAGTVLDIAWGEHLDDLRVRARVGERNFACKYICKDGRQSFTHYFTRLAGRYLQIHISNVSSDVTLHYAGIIPAEYPVEVKGSFTCNDSFFNKIYETSVRTLHLCMHEHYEDCPWREQALYAMDMRNQALAGYHCFGEYDFPAASLDLLSKGLKPDGFLEMCAPAEIPITIPSFTLAWVLAVADHYQYSGNADFAKRVYPVMKSIIDNCAKSIGDGVLPSPSGKRYWHFYDWADGLDGTQMNDCNQFQTLDEPRYDAPLNMFYLLALDAAAKVADAAGDKESQQAYITLAANLRPRIHEKFWDENDEIYLTYAQADFRTHKAEFIQALAILSGVCTDDIAHKLRKKLATDNNGLVKATLSHSLYKFEALLTDKQTYAKFVFNSIANDWGHMLTSGATSFWETIKGEADFDNAGSLCHGWSGIPAYFYNAYILGVKPAAPGFEKFTFEPVEGIVDKASGAVPTPHGPINIDLKMGERNISSPEDTKMVN